MEIGVREAEVAALLDSGVVGAIEAHAAQHRRSAREPWPRMAVPRISKPTRVALVAKSHRSKAVQGPRFTWLDVADIARQADLDRRHRIVALDASRVGAARIPQRDLVMGIVDRRRPAMPASRRLHHLGIGRDVVSGGVRVGLRDAQGHWRAENQEERVRRAALDRTLREGSWNLFRYLSWTGRPPRGRAGSKIGRTAARSGGALRSGDTGVRSRHIKRQSRAMRRGAARCDGDRAAS